MLQIKAQGSGTQTECSGFFGLRKDRSEFRDTEAAGIFRVGHPRGERLKIMDKDLLEPWLGTKLHTFRVRLQKVRQRTTTVRCELNGDSRDISVLINQRVNPSLKIHSS